MATEPVIPTAPSFGPSALATPANGVTVVRVLFTPLLVVLIVGREDPASWTALGLWFLLAGTDTIDGWLARRQGTTRSGAFLDPLADKVLVLGALAALVAAQRFWWLPAALIAFREVAISLFRSYWGRRGLAVPATGWAKVKAVVQDAAIGLALLPWAADTPWVAQAVLWAAVVLTLATGIQYLLEGSRATRTTGCA
ncbi:MAG: CDP-alcohol phosphatidyltransferase family protein [Acidimicrobiales bacterium]